MKIINNFYIRRNPSAKQPHNQSFAADTQNPINNTKSKIFAYQDFTVNFTGRTPEDFYAQDFNLDNMPITMKHYLNYDYEQRRHIPPEQMMHEVFKYIEDAKDFDQVKLLYPNEPLFKNIHELTKKPRTGILSEIRIARELSDTPLFKDGSDNFGMYLLRKIYSEGKTIKEISKDFLEKDINDEYKGFITQPIDYSTTSAYGIRYPKNDFWHSFIATREEYKKFFVTLPKDTVDPNRTGLKPSSATQPHDSLGETHKVVKTPRYKLKPYKKKNLIDDIKRTDGSKEQVEKVIRKRFSKDDPEASFIIKYLSPIMTVAADRIHLSEEEKAFSEYEKANGKTGNEKTMFGRFWKANPALLEHYSKSITDTIEMFEEVYGYGGMIPINNDFEIITKNTENQKAIDYVLPEFVELLNYTQNIVPEREKRYAEHDLMQAQWERHFLDRYGEVAENVDETPAQTQDINAVLSQAEENGAKIYPFNLSNGTTIHLAVNPEEMLRNKICIDYDNMPKAFVRKYINFILKHPKATEDYLLAFACTANDMMKWGNFVIDNGGYTDDELKKMNEQVIKELKSQMMSEDTVLKTMHEIYNDFEAEYPKLIDLTKQAVMEYSTRLNAPDDDYLKVLIEQRYKQMEDSGLIQTEIKHEDKLDVYKQIYKQTIEAIHSMKSHKIVYLDTKLLQAGLSFLSIGNNTLNAQDEMDKIIEKYKAPLTNAERNNISRKFMDIMLNMTPDETAVFNISDNNISGFYLSSMEGLRKNKNFRKEFYNLLYTTVVTPKNKTLRYLIDENADKNLAAAKAEREVVELMKKQPELFMKLASLDLEAMKRYIKPTNPDLYNHLIRYRMQAAISASLGLDKK